MNQDKRQKIFAQLAANIKNPTTELNYQSDFQLLISVILSAQATDVSVNKASKKLFAVAGNPQKIYDLGVDKLKLYIKTIGLFNTKAKNIIQTCRLLIDEYDGKVPTTREQLEKLPGVGRKTANVVLNTAFGHETIAVDTHIYRVCNRSKLVIGKTVLEVEKKLLKVVPQEYKKDAHHLLILHGRYTCIARKPKCCECVIYQLCEYKEKLTCQP